MADRGPLPFWHPAHVIATWFGVGYAPFASGTFGSLAALPFAWCIHVYWGGLALLAASLVLFVIGCWAAELYIRRQGKGDDPGQVVADEVAGQWLLLAGLAPTLPHYAIGFALFRLFDVLKPWPVSYADRHLHGGFGAMLDDLLAGAYPLFLLFLTMILLNLTGQEALLRQLLAFLHVPAAAP